MNVISTTNPIAPTGATPTEVPFGISGSTTLNSIPADLQPASGSMLYSGHGLFLTRFSISTLDTVGSVVWNFDARFPLGRNAFENRYYRVSSGGNYRPIVPWDLWPVWFSAQCRVDYELVFVPVKVGDSRVSLDFVFDYSGLGNTGPYGTDTLVQDSFHKLIDDQDDQFSFTVPLIYVTKLVNTVPPKFGTLAPTSNDFPAFLPQTTMQVFIRSPYQPNLMQPNSFDVLVFMRPIVRDTQTVVGRSRSVLRPYVFNIST
jgi:hypothetical protein